MRLRRIYFLIAAVAVALFLVEGKAFCQYRQHSVGIKFGNEISVNYHCRLSSRSAINVTGGLVNPYNKSYQYLVVSGAYHCNLSSRSSQLTPYIGVGVSSGVQYGEKNSDKSTTKHFYFSGDVPMGFQFYSEDRPSVFYFEWSPKIRITNGVEFVPNSVAVGVRFYLRS